MNATNRNVPPMGGYSSIPPNGGVTNEQMAQFISQLRQNPAQLENYLKQSNPQAFQRALEIRNAPNAREIVMQMARTSNINPAILHLLGIN